MVGKRQKLLQLLNRIMNVHVKHYKIMEPNNMSAILTILKYFSLLVRVGRFVLVFS